MEVVRFCRSPPVHGGLTLFIFFSGRLGCLGSIIASLVVTLILLAVFGVL